MSPFTFGVYPGGPTGLDTPRLPDDPDRVRAALDELSAGQELFLVRAYRGYADRELDVQPTPADPAGLLAPNRKLDLVTQFREKSGALGGWLDFLEDTAYTDGAMIHRLQVAEEPNAANLPVLDGAVPNVLQAVAYGVPAAAQAAREGGHDLLVGFNAVPGPPSFWDELGALATDEFHLNLGYVGLDFFPDVFAPIPPAELAGRVEGLLRALRGDWLPRAGIRPEVPVVVAENGWSTGPDRPEARQAEVLNTVVRTVHRLAGELNITGYTWFDLRDSDSTGGTLFDRFGLLHDDYTAKPAFGAYRDLVAELGR